MQAKALLTDDYGKDLASVEALIRRHDELERDLTAIENKLEVHIWYTMFMYCFCLNVTPGFYLLSGPGDLASKQDWPLFGTGVYKISAGTNFLGRSAIPTDQKH